MSSMSEDWLLFLLSRSLGRDVLCGDSWGSPVWSLHMQLLQTIVCELYLLYTGPSPRSVLLSVLGGSALPQEGGDQAPGS